MSTSWKCTVCGKPHEETPASFAADFPDMYANMNREDRETRAVIGTDQCVIDQKWFFVRGCLEVPINESDDVFLWGLWASVREDVFDEITDCWETPGREKTRGPFKGRLGNSLSVYPETLNLKLKLIIQPVGARPLFIIEESGHLFGAEQQSGISQGRAIELASLLLHQQRFGSVPSKFP